MKKRALITGLTGQDGSYLAELLLEKDYEVYGLVRRSSTSTLSRVSHVLSKIHLITGDLLDQSSLMDAIAEAEPDEIYNLASQSYVPISWSQPALTAEYTGLGVARLLESIRRIRPKARFYQASSSEVFGQPDESPQTEKTAFRPRNPYGAAKAYAHWLTTNYRDYYGLHASCGITYTHESPRRGSEFAFRKITEGAAKISLNLASELKLGNLDARRDWCYAKDAVYAMWLMLQQDQPDDYVIASGEAHLVKDVVKCAFGVVNLNWEDYVTVDPSLVRQPEKADLIGDISKISSTLDWRPKHSFEELVKIMVDYDLQKIQESIEAQKKI
jgi:GDPmannose 4,6-dehydratase